MGREISYICDACGRDCTGHYYVLSVVRRMGAPYRLNVGGDEPILCPECFMPVQAFLSRLENVEWVIDDDEEF